ncbi:MAG: hypothetical protein ACR2F9_01605 [Longimicrobiaceae bacterium]
MESDDLTFRISMATAYTALALLGLSLTMGPYNVLRGRPNPVSTHRRRDIGILAAGYAWLHTVAGFQVHFRGRIRFYVLDPADNALRLDPFGFANYAGLAALLVVSALLVLSNDFSLRTLGTARWKRLQRCNYAALGLLVGHGALYQLIEKRSAAWVAAFLLCVVLIVALQSAGFRRRRAAHRG